MLRLFPWVFDGRAWWHARHLELGEDASRIFSMVQGVLQTVQRAEDWGVLLALQALMPLHSGVDNLIVCNNVAKVLRGWTGTPFPFALTLIYLPALHGWFGFGVQPRLGLAR